MGYFLFLASDYKPRPGGIASYLDSLARGLIAVGDRVRILAVVEPDDCARIAFLEHYEPWVSPFVVVHDTRPQQWLAGKCVSVLEIVRCLWPAGRRVLERTSLFQSSRAATTALERIVADDPPSMVVIGHLDLNLYPLVLCLQEHRVPYALIAHDFEISKRAYRVNDIVRRGLMVRGARWLAANSSHTKRLLEAWGVQETRIVTVHPPIAEEAIRESAAAAAIRRTGCFSIVTVSRIVRNKGIDIVVRALKTLVDEGVPCRYVVAGDGPERPALERLADDLGVRQNVVFTGYVTEESKWSLLREADVFVMPSRVNPHVQHEGFGLAFIEAAAFGVPGIGSTGGGIPDAIVDGRTGLLVREESPGDLAQAMLFLYRNPDQRHAMGEAARERATREFSPRSTAGRFRTLCLQ